MSDTIRIEGVRAVGFHGVFDEERRNGQEFVVDVEIHTDTSKAAASDDVIDTVHYGEVAEALVEVIKGPSVNLIERLAELLAAKVLDFSGVDGVRVTVHKPQAPISVPFSDVSVTIERQR
jgi:dihydroneopterin aldolase